MPLMLRRTSASSWPKSSRNDCSAFRTSRSSSSVSSIVCMWGTLTPVGRLVSPFERRAEGDELEPLVSRDRHPRRAGIDADEPPGPELDLLVVDPHHAGATHHEVDLLHVRVDVVVLAPLGAGRQREVVEPERTRTGGTPRLPHHPAGPSPSSESTSTNVNPTATS